MAARSVDHGLRGVSSRWRWALAARFSRTRWATEEQFRVPKELRELQVTPENESWAARATGTLNEGTGSARH
jgi:hypothetical protein